MKLTLITVSFVLASLLLATGCAIVANRFYVPPAVEVVDAPEMAPGALDTLHPDGALSIVTWNIGYAGMGAESDFVMDMGQQERPLSGAIVADNLTKLVAKARSFDADVILFQEMARPSWNTYGTDVLAAFEAGLEGYASVFGADILTRYVPPPFRVEMGNAIFSKVAAIMVERRALPLEPNFQYGVFRKGYRMHILRLAGAREWVLINIHLSAFDDEASVRNQQLQAVLGFAMSEYRQGRYVVVGGDWNLRLAPTEFSHNTAEKYRFWIYDFPSDRVPAGWRWGVDPTHPTVRTAHAPYVHGENYRLIVDGFLLSPNVKIEAVETLDLDFAHTDHNPVRIRLRPISGAE